MVLNKTITAYFSALCISPVFYCSDLQAHSWEAPREEAQQRNPLESDTASINIGKEIFLQNCSECHGNNAEGLKSAQTGLAKDTGNLPKRLKSHSDGDFFWKIKNGKGDMPSFRNELTEEQIWQVIIYISNIDK